MPFFSRDLSYAINIILYNTYWNLIAPQTFIFCKVHMKFSHVHIWFRLDVRYRCRLFFQDAQLEAWQLLYIVITFENFCQRIQLSSVLLMQVFSLMSMFWCTHYSLMHWYFSLICYMRFCCWFWSPLIPYFLIKYIFL